MTIPLNKQRLPPDFVENIKFDHARGQAVAGEDLLRALEQRLGPLPSDLRELFPFFSIPAVRQRGRPANDRGREDFGMKQLDARYRTLLRKFRDEPDSVPPSERAYRQLAAEMKDILGYIHWRALSNKHSAWKTGRFHGPEDGFVDSEDFDVEIERQFPAHK